MQKDFGERFQMENCTDKRRSFAWYDHLGSQSQFEENEKGSLEKGKLADFVILDTDIMKEVPANKNIKYTSAEKTLFGRRKSI